MDKEVLSIGDSGNVVFAGIWLPDQHVLVVLRLGGELPLSIPCRRWSRWSSPATISEPRRKRDGLLYFEKLSRKNTCSWFYGWARASLSPRERRCPVQRNHPQDRFRPGAEKRGALFRGVIKENLFFVKNCLQKVFIESCKKCFLPRNTFCKVTLMVRNPCMAYVFALRPCIFLKLYYYGYFSIFQKFFLNDLNFHQFLHL